MRIFRLLPIGCLLILSACSDYSLTVNEKVVYTPPGIFTDFHLEDIELQRCADQSIAEASITAAKQLERLQCPDKGIRSVRGISVFSELTVLGLEGNQLNNLEELASLNKLEQLNLAANNIQDVSALHNLQQLHYLDLRKNPGLDCVQLAGIKLAKNGRLLRPSHCE